MQYHYVYRTLCLVNGKFYIGVHSTKDLHDNYLGSGKLLKRAIKKYGEASFKREILQFFPTKLLAYHFEKQVIKPYLGHPLCYNLHEGGKGGWGHVKQPERIEAVRKAWLGRKHEDDSKRKIGLSSSVHQGGIGNSQHGLCWISLDRAQLTTKVPRSEVDDWLAQDWRLGRKMNYTHVRAALLNEIE